MQHKKKVYYAHPMNLYNTAQEKRDIEMLEALGFDVENPNSEAHQRTVKVIQGKFDKVHSSIAVMEYFKGIVTSCDAVAFRAFVDLSIGAGVYDELKELEEIGKPVIELPTITQGRVLSVEATRQYLRYSGQR